MAKLKNHTTHNQNTRFAKKHSKKGLKKMQANNAKAMSARAEAVKALRKPKEVKPKILKRNSRKLSQLAYTAHPRLRKCAHAHIAKGLRLCRPKAKDEAQTKATASAAAPAPAPKISSHPCPAPIIPPRSDDSSPRGCRVASDLSKAPAVYFKGPPNVTHTSPCPAPLLGDGAPSPRLGGWRLRIRHQKKFWGSTAGKKWGSGRGRSRGLRGVATPSPPLHSGSLWALPLLPLLPLLLPHLLLLLLRVGAPAALPVSDQPQGTDGEAWGAPSPEWVTRVCWETAGGGGAGAAGRRQRPGWLGAGRAVPLPLPFTAFATLRAQRPRRVGPTGLPLRTSALGLLLEGKFKQQSEESRLGSEGRGWGLVQIHAVRAGLPDPGHQRQSSIPLSGAQHPPTPRLSFSFFGSCYSCCYFPFPAFPWEAPVPQAGISSLGPAPALEGDEPGRGATATGAFTPAHTFPAGVTFTGIWRWVPWTRKEMGQPELGFAST
ncbi:60S ribosomal protein L29 [Camelus dromedarius]|uniref:60S ribosomal protein L29 n=1 Tax=Camelus dromedarius TaxID=9838 RepID=A0A5N4D7B5_CAMDR|nr:60S ribosomal protein L29 [Camelus dromedarius]